MKAEEVNLIKKEIAFSGYFQVVLYHLKHRLFEGGWGQEIKREVFERGHAASALLYDPEKDKLVFIEQFRVGAYAALSSPWYDGKSMSPWLIEVVAGIIEDGETPEGVIRRECIEEAGCEIIEMMPICQYLVTPGGSSETVFAFCGRVKSCDSMGIHGVAEEGENIRVFAIDAMKVFKMLEQGEIKNSMTIIPLQWFSLNRDLVRRRWLG